jgi:hypothetical protein
MNKSIRPGFRKPEVLLPKFHLQLLLLGFTLRKLEFEAVFRPLVSTRLLTILSKSKEPSSCLFTQERGM